MNVSIIGGTGLTGRQIIPLLAIDHDVYLLGRRKSSFDVRQSVAPIGDWPHLIGDDPVDVAISALGTTWKKSGGWEAFAAVDHEGVVEFAKASRSGGARQFITISSVGADPSSRNPYLSLKGRVESDLALLGFDRLDVLRPGLLKGPRGADRRRGERLGILLSPLTNVLLRGPFDRFAAIDAGTVAAAVAALVGDIRAGVFVHHNREIRALSKRAG